VPRALLSSWLTIGNLSRRPYSVAISHAVFFYRESIARIAPISEARMAQISSDSEISLGELTWPASLRVVFLPRRCERFGRVFSSVK